MTMTRVQCAVTAGALPPLLPTLLPPDLIKMKEFTVLLFDDFGTNAFNQGSPGAEFF